MRPEQFQGVGYHSPAGHVTTTPRLAPTSDTPIASPSTSRPPNTSPVQPQRPGASYAFRDSVRDRFREFNSYGRVPPAVGAAGGFLTYFFNLFNQ